MNRSLALVVATAALAFGALAPRDRQEKQGDLVVTLAPDGSFLQVGKPVRVKLGLENRGTKVLEIPNGALFGEDLLAKRLDGGGDTTTYRYSEATRRVVAGKTMMLPPGASVAATVDVAELLPEAFKSAGRCSITYEVAGATSPPVEIELARDWTGFHATLETEFGEIELEFFPDAAPRTVANFLSLVDRHFYDGLTFHRVVKGFMVQGGDPKGDGTGNSGKFVPFEKSGIKHERGVISMARQADFNSASCQFFLVHQTAPFLDGNYASFGRIVRGLEVLDRIADVPCTVNPKGVDRGPSKPKDVLRITKLRLVPPAGPAGTNK